MDNTSANHYEEQYTSPNSHIYLDVKLEDVSGMINQQLLHSASGTVENSPTYTYLETVYPETNSPSSTQYFPYTSPATSIQPLYSYTSNVQNTTDFPLLHTTLYRDPDLNQTARDEGLGSSPSSFSSTTPPLSQPQPTVLVPSRPSSNYDCSLRSTSSPESTVSSAAFSTEVFASTARECSNCGNTYDIYWVNTHYLCRQCFPDRVPPKPPTPTPSPSGSKRKRSSVAFRNINQVCTNCDARDSTLWRRSSSSGNTVCNACGLYEKLHHVPRPKHMRKDTIQTRKRKPKASQSPKSKRTTKRMPIKSEPITDEHQQYVPNALQHYPLPNYQTLHARNFPSNVNNLHSSMVPPMTSHQPMYTNLRPELYRPDIYNPVLPNEIMNVPQNMSPSSMPYTNL